MLIIRIKNIKNIKDPLGYDSFLRQYPANVKTTDNGDIEISIESLFEVDPENIIDIKELISTFKFKNNEPKFLIINDSNLIDIQYAKHIKILSLSEILVKLDINEDSIDADDLYSELIFKNLDMSINYISKIASKKIRLSDIDIDNDFKTKSHIGTYPNEIIDYIIDFN